MTKLPEWSTPERQRHLVALFDRCGGFCVFGHRGCQIDNHHYEFFIEGVIDSWKAEDTERRNYEWKLEQRAIRDGTYGRYGTDFDPVSRDVFVNSRPTYYLVGLGVNPFTYKRVAMIRIPSTSVHLFVDVGPANREVSKNARRKAMRYGKVINGALMEQVNLMCLAAVGDWWGERKIVA